MNPEGLKAFFRWGVLLIVLSVVLLFAQTPGTPEFIVTILTIGIGVILITLVALVARRP